MAALSLNDKLAIEKSLDKIGQDIIKLHRYLGQTTPDKPLGKVIGNAIARMEAEGAKLKATYEAINDKPKLSKMGKSK